MNTVETESRPVVLVVEDNERALDLRIKLFSGADCTPIGVSSHDDAVRELRAVPGVDLVVTDIHLVAHEPGDQSGVALARYVKQVYADMPVAGYSAVFGDEELIDAHGFFDAIWPKPLDYKRIEEMVRVCRERAVAHRQRRREAAFEAHTLLRRRHELAHPEVELMRELRPGTGSAAPVEQALSEAGYRLQLVEAAVNGLGKPIIVWLLDYEGGVEAEVYGQPALYADGKDDGEAIHNLVDLMRLYAEEIGPRAPEAVGPALSLSNFLEQVMANEDER